MTGDHAADELARVVRENAGRLAASLMSLLGDFSAAEDLVQDAVETALRRWPEEGIPDRPDAWLFTVAKRRGLDVLRRQENYLSKLITRAKRKIAQAGIPYRIPRDDELPERLNEVLTVIYLLFNEGYLSSTGDRAHSRDLVDDAEWLTALLAGLLPNEPEVTGLLALIRLHRARVAARFTSDGQLVLLQDQNRAEWDHAAIADATALLTRTARRHRSPGPYQLQAAIAGCHCEAPTWADTDWRQIL